ncbi:DUF4227 family protein [Salsuginibacillus kocurii]|uniref:DUF4227 family protein n=1 Tax=Salsuginibacillus kocurii TaxID=427078 RepID=UPI00037B6CE6|nr:DUF4227 family protein [Salsuginibacillus kocurii]
MIKKAWETLKVIVIFTCSTLFFYYGILWLHEEYRGDERLEHPEEVWVEVSESDDSMLAGWDRFLYLLRHGE